MKMLTGMLCKVINAIAVSETEKMLVGFAQDELLEVLIEMGYCNAPDIHHVDFEDLFVSQEIFAEMMSNDRAVAAFRRIGVDCIGLCASADFIFPELDEADIDKEEENWRHQHEHKRVPFADFMDSILQLRGSQTATVKDMVDIRKFVRHELLQVEHNLSLAVNHQCTRVLKGLGAKSGGRTAMRLGKGADLHKRGGALVDYGGSEGSHGKAASKDEDEESFSLAHRTVSQRNSLTSLRSEAEPEPAEVSEPDEVDEPAAEEKEPWKSENSTDAQGATADLVFECFCELDEAERARFFTLMACGSSQGVPPGRRSSAAIPMTAYQSDRDSLVEEPQRDTCFIELPPGRALASNGLQAAILHARRASGEARSDPHFYLRTAANQHVLPGPGRAVGDRAMESPSDSASAGFPTKVGL